MKPKIFVWLIFIEFIVFFISSAFALTLREKVKYVKFLTGSKIELTPQEREKYAKAFMESASGLTLKISFFIQDIFKRRFYEM